MKGGYLIAVALAAVVVMISAVDRPITPIPTSCPAEDSLNYTVHLRHETDCTKFYKCQWGQRIEMDCPVRNRRGDRLHFNALLQVCDYPSRAGCSGSTPIIGTSTERTPTNWTSCYNAPDGIRLPHETRCYLFYECLNQVNVLQYCPENTIYDSERQLCDEPTTSTCLVNHVCRNHRDSQGVYFPDPTSCKHVYYCRGIVTTRYVCDVDAEWSESAGRCVQTDQAGCVRRYNY